MSGLEYSIEDWHEDNNLENTLLWERKGNLFKPYLIVSYAYSPIENKGVFVRINMPVQPVLYRMGIQLIVSIGLTLLLIICLIFQLKTILKQKKINEIRENFVNTMTHELKRPVQTLKTFVSVLNDKKMRSDEETMEQIVRDSMFELDNLSAYLNKLKDMLRVDNENTSLHKVSIEIKTGQSKHKVWVSVRDNGIGINDIEQDKIFTKFYRGSNIPDKNIPGIGLGLSYVKLIVEAHQGSIDLQSKIDEGTTITLYLPQ